MNVKELLKTYNITQDELSVFMGIPRSRISMWKDYPIKAADVKLFEMTAKFLASFPTDYGKSAIKNNRIFLNNIIPVHEHGEQISSGIISEPSESYVKPKNTLTDDKDEEPNDLLTSDFTKNDDPMINRLMAMLEKSLANEERVTIALERTTRTTENLSAILVTFTGSLEHHNSKKAMEG